MPADLITGSIQALATLVDTIIKHVDKDPETLRLLKKQALDDKLYDLGEQIDALMTRISLEGEK